MYKLPLSLSAISVYFVLVIPITKNKPDGIFAWPREIMGALLSASW